MENPKLIVITGPMFAGKTTMLIEEAKKAAYANRKIVLFRSEIDNRYSISEVVSHDGVKLSAVTLPRGEECIKTLKEAANDYEIIFIDEGHFWKDTKGFAQALDEIVYMSRTVYVAMLNKDIDGLPFGISKELVPLADNVHTLEAKCVKCGNVATFTQRVVDGVENFEDKFMPGGSNLYQARCRNCFVRHNK